jgi:hypothetical protein
VIRIISGAFLVFHGLVHLLYFGQSTRLFELQAGMLWPDGSWALSKLLGENGTRMLIGILCILAAAGFVAGGAGMLFRQSWWRAAVVATAAFSAVIYILSWNGRVQHWDVQGGVGLLIDVAILTAVLGFRWPQTDF